ncbi:MAG: mononuclear molybdenum enzyme YedY, partial [Gammaproteobacteria bacterium]|nr:mononuclear molybdenum enzyme YedY [Gammaproteobacteria bacterium]
MTPRIPRIPPSQITPPEVYFNRRSFLAVALGAGVGASITAARAAVLPAAAGAPLAFTPNPAESVAALVRVSGQDETPNTWEEITNYNNYYEFGVDKTDPAENAHRLSTRPWSVAVE